MRVANRIFGQQVGNGVAHLGVARLFPKTLQLALVLAVFDGRRIHPSVDRLARDPNVQTCELTLLVQTGGHLALRQGTVKVVRLVFFAAPDQLDGRARKLLGNRHRLRHIVLLATTAAKGAAQVGDVDLALFEWQTRRLGQDRQRGFGILAGHPDLSLVGGDQGGAVVGLKR